MIAPKGPSWSIEHRWGSVLVPAVVALVVLFYCGAALAHLFAAYRIGSVAAVHAERALWIAEAGLWHAARQQSSVGGPIAFAGGDYQVEKSGSSFVSTGAFESAHRTITQTIVGSSADGVGPVDTDPAVLVLDVEGAKIVNLTLVSLSPEDALLSAWSLSSPTNADEVQKLSLSGRDVWQRWISGFLPLGPFALNKGTPADHVIEAYATEELRLQFRSFPSGTVDYTLVLFFANGTSNVIEFTVTWS